MGKRKIACVRARSLSSCSCKAANQSALAGKKWSFSLYPFLLLLKVPKCPGLGVREAWVRLDVKY
jgi:hypothetical protein